MNGGLKKKKKRKRSTTARPFHADTSSSNACAQVCPTKRRFRTIKSLIARSSSTTRIYAILAPSRFSIALNRHEVVLIFPLPYAPASPRESKTAAGGSCGGVL